ncbi:hypothetical protein NEMIN01_0485 [Nematocida minor]|uniref:uncharacterized protein n=1 Tax=Nematocida minor TaxID=1912983 RepID=UPI00221EE02D|nr:uncharacterized protein NEMIN01_0485 [Nematocida minor]KAI5189422.1 hypothetical protein NEMIN01_0485 [Nematocida minor]
MAARTPRRTAQKRTPYNKRTVETKEEKETENQDTNSNLTDLIRYYREKEAIREEYIEALREENAHLRRNSSVSTDYSELTGLSISKVENHLHCKQAIEKEGKVSSISFTLERTSDGYTYTYQNSKHIESLPEYLKKEIYFDEDQIKLFFFNVYECVAREE